MAIYTFVDPQALACLLRLYDIGELVDAVGIREGIENTNYRITTDRGTFILTIYEKRVRRDELPFFLALMGHLAGRGIPCPLPVRTRDGGLLTRIRDKPAAIVTFLEGRWPRRISVERCRALGEILARLHIAGQDVRLRRPNDLGPPAWGSLIAACRRGEDTGFAWLGELQTIVAETVSAWPVGLPEGIIHADLFPDNVFFAEDRVTGVFDFYFACGDLLAYDIAICLNAWCFEADGSFNVTKSRGLLSGYEAIRPLSAGERENLPILARGAAIRFLATRLYDWLHRVDGAEVTPKDPREYWAKVRFHRQIESSSAYGID